MMSLHALRNEAYGPATRLSEELGVAVDWVAMHRFPDGETLPTVSNAAPVALIYRSLHNPNAKLIECLLMEDALRRAGAAHIVLVAPYVPYLRQDKVFEPGQPLSRDVIIPLLARRFDAIATVDPHLHRTARLDQVAAETRWIVISGAEAIAEGLRQDCDNVFDIIIGPDAESQQWVKTVADALGLPFSIFAKKRQGDRRLTLTPPDDLRVSGARALIVDDVCASGGTLAAAANVLRALGAKHIEAAVTHALFGEADADFMKDAGIVRVRSCDGCPHASNAFSLAPTLAAALRLEKFS